MPQGTLRQEVHPLIDVELAGVADRHADPHESALSVGRDCEERLALVDLLVEAAPNLWETRIALGSMWAGRI